MSQHTGFAKHLGVPTTIHAMAIKMLRQIGISYDSIGIFFLNAIHCYPILEDPTSHQTLVEAWSRELDEAILVDDHSIKMEGIIHRLRIGWDEP